MSDINDAKKLDWQPGFSYHEDHSAQPADYWHVRMECEINGVDVHTDWVQIGWEKGQRDTFSDTKKAQAAIELFSKLTGGTGQ